MKGYGYCPLHEWDSPSCTDECIERKRALRQVNRELDALWYARRHGVRPFKGKYFGWAAEKVA